MILLLCYSSQNKNTDTCHVFAVKKSVMKKSVDKLSCALSVIRNVAIGNLTAPATPPGQVPDLFYFIFSFLLFLYYCVNYRLNLPFPTFLTAITSV